MGKPVEVSGPSGSRRAGDLAAVQRHILHYLRRSGATYRQAAPSSVIAAALNLYPSYVREQARDLVNRGLLCVRPGRRGGYYLPTGPHEDSATWAPMAHAVLSLGELQPYLEHYLAVWRRYRVTFSLVRVEWVDRQAFALRHGAQAAAAVLAEAAAEARTALRAVDLVAVDGGGALLVMLPHTGRPAAQRVGDRLLERLGVASIPTAARMGLALDFAASVASVPEDGETAEALLQAVRLSR